MTELSFTCLEATHDQYSAAPTLLFRLRIDGPAELQIRAIALTTQIRIEPARRGYGEEDADRLLELFGERGRWGDTLKPFQFANISTTLAGFTGSTEVTVHVPCSYDMEVTAGRYFHALHDGEIPFILLFSGTIFSDGEQSVWIQRVPWHAEARYRMPVSVWREMMDTHFPGTGWLRLRRDTIDALAEFRAARALPTWDDAVIGVLEAARERTGEGGA